MWEPGEPMANIEERVIKAAIEYCDGNKKAAAKMLDISYQTVLNKLEVYDRRDREKERNMKIADIMTRNKLKVADGEMPAKFGVGGNGKPQGR